MKAGDRVLVHAAAGGVGQAAVQLAKAAGATVYATASPHKWPVLRAQGVEHLFNSRTLDFADALEGGVDIVLNSLNKDFIPAGLRTLAPGGRFVELGKVGVWSTEQVAAEFPHVEYHNFDFSELPADEVTRINKEIMTDVAARIAAGGLDPVGTTGYTLDEVEEAFGVLSRGANVGKLVLGFDQPAPPAAIRDDRTYLVTGGLDGLGLLTARKLVALGARHIAVPGPGEAPELAGAHVTVLGPDLAGLERTPPVAGVVLADGDPEQAWRLHERFPAWTSSSRTPTSPPPSARPTGRSPRTPSTTSSAPARRPAPPRWPSPGARWASRSTRCTPSPRPRRCAPSPPWSAPAPA
ncbi:zinc-binding dehydrogenase [Actinokineospora soli]|uniref:Zinc-binding dehydrogenase n=1 Tax=Actinokineospora soli TaxID=1048753 RepID=A0ABW2TKH9_9PSEU